MSLIKYFLFLLFSLLIFSSAHADQIIVTDGDTIRIGDERIRFSGIDTPEIGQICIKAEGPFDCGLKAKEILIAR